MSAGSILERWGITEHELTELVDQNPSLRGIMSPGQIEARENPGLNAIAGLP